MNAIEYISYLVANDLLTKHTADTAYEMYENSTEEEISSKGFFKAKFNAKKRKLGIPLDVLEPMVETSARESEEDFEVPEEPVNLVESKDNDTIKEQLDLEEVSKELSTQEEVLPKPCLDTMKQIKEGIVESLSEEDEIGELDFSNEMTTPEREENISLLITRDSSAVVERELEVKRYNNGDKLPELPGLIPTGTLFDSVICDRVTSDEEKLTLPNPVNWSRGGFTRKCCDVIAGKAGSGKTYSRTILACMAKALNPNLKIGFVCGEMREVEWIKEVHSAPILADLEVVYMLNYVGQSNYERIFYQAIKDYDIVIVDSFPAIISHIKMSPGERRSDKAITFDLIREINLSVDKYNYNMQLLNQATKDGNYKGGTELPHMMSSQSYVKVDGQKRYMEFEKNRNNGNTIGRKVYFSKNKVTGVLEFNLDVYKATYEQKEDTKQDLKDFFANQSSASDALADNEVNRLSPIEMTDEEMSDAGDTNIVVSNNTPSQVSLLDSIKEIEDETKEEITK